MRNERLDEFDQKLQDVVGASLEEVLLDALDRNAEVFFRDLLMDAGRCIHCAEESRSLSENGRCVSCELEVMDQRERENPFREFQRKP